MKSWHGKWPCCQDRVALDGGLFELLITEGNVLVSRDMSSKLKVSTMRSETVRFAKVKIPRVQLLGAVSWEKGSVA
eukprot:6456966-Amphidinium_carterae.3